MALGVSIYIPIEYRGVWGDAFFLSRDDTTEIFSASCCGWGDLNLYLSVFKEMKIIAFLCSYVPVPYLFSIRHCSTL